MDYEKKLELAMAGIEPYRPDGQNSVYTFSNISTGNTHPPAYIVAFVFLAMLKFENYGSAEKVWWHTYFKYKNVPFLIRDYKFGSWSLESKDDIESAKKLVPEVEGKIRRASRYADKLLEAEFKKVIQKGEFYIHNAYRKLRDAYEFYRTETEIALDIVTKHHEKRSAEKPDTHRAVQLHNESLDLQTRLVYRSVPLMTSFFSLLEFIVDVFFAFEQIHLSFFEFRNLSWQDRFKKVIPLESGSDYIRLYEKLVGIKSQYRNPLAHGLTNESALLVPFPFAGLVPISYEHLSKSIHFGYVQISAKSIQELLNSFGEFLNRMSDEEPFCYYMLYMESGFSIPVAKEDVSSIRAMMTDPDHFEQYLQDRSRYGDAITNRDI